MSVWACVSRFGTHTRNNTEYNARTCAAVVVPLLLLCRYVVLDAADLRVLFCSPPFAAGLSRLTRRPQLDTTNILTLLVIAAWRFFQ